MVGTGRRSRSLMIVGSLFRAAVGAGYLFAPASMGRLGLAPDTRDSDDGRMSLRGFGALHSAVAFQTLRGALRGDAEGSDELALNLACAVGDTVATVLEWRTRAKPDRVVVGSLPLDIVDIVWWTVALRSRTATR